MSHHRHSQDKIRQLRDAVLTLEHLLKQSELARGQLEDNIEILLARNAVLAEDNSILRAQLLRSKRA